MFGQLYNFQNKLKEIKHYLEQVQPDIDYAIRMLDHTQTAYKKLISYNSDELTTEQKGERGNIILTILLDQIKIDYLIGLHRGTQNMSFEEHLSIAISEMHADITTPIV